MFLPILLLPYLAQMLWSLCGWNFALFAVIKVLVGLWISVGHAIKLFVIFFFFGLSLEFALLWVCMCFAFIDPWDPSYWRAIFVMLSGSFLAGFRVEMKRSCSFKPVIFLFSSILPFLFVKEMLYWNCTRIITKLILAYYMVILFALNIHKYHKSCPGETSCLIC